MCYHSKQTKIAVEVQSQFKDIIDNTIVFKPAAHANGFEHLKTPVIIDEKPNIITHYNWAYCELRLKIKTLKNSP